MGFTYYAECDHLPYSSVDLALSFYQAEVGPGYRFGCKPAADGFIHPAAQPFGIGRNHGGSAHDGPGHPPGIGCGIVGALHYQSRLSIGHYVALTSAAECDRQATVGLPFYQRPRQSLKTGCGYHNVAAAIERYDVG